MFRDSKGGSDEIFEGRGHSEAVVPRQINNAELRRVVVPRQNTRTRDLREACCRTEWNGIVTWNQSCGWREKVQAEVSGFRCRQGWARTRFCAIETRMTSRQLASHPSGHSHS